jgi:hypothetical protein
VGSAWRSSGEQLFKPASDFTLGYRPAALAAGKALTLATAKIIALDIKTSTYI